MKQATKDVNDKGLGADPNSLLLAAIGRLSYDVRKAVGNPGHHGESRISKAKRVGTQSAAGGGVFYAVIEALKALTG